jgi:gliding motility-associated lipoprotein GldH
MKNAYLYLYCLMVFTCLACEDHLVYRNKHQLPHHVWPVTAVQRFDFYITDPRQAYKIILLVDNRLTYPYQNLFIACGLKGSEGELLQTLLKDCQLFESKTGKPLGKGWRRTKKHEFILLPAYQFQQPGNYQLELTQFMRADELIGIEAIGIQVSKASLQATSK